MELLKALYHVIMPFCDISKFKSDKILNLIFATLLLQLARERSCDHSSTKLIIKADNAFINLFVAFGTET